MILSGSRKFLFQTFSEHFMAVLQTSDKTTELHVQTPSFAFCAETYLIPRTGFILGCDCRQEVTSATSDSLHALLTQSNREIKHRQRWLQIIVEGECLQPLYSLQEQQKCVDFASKCLFQLLNSFLSVYTVSDNFDAVCLSGNQKTVPSNCSSEEKRQEA